MTKKQQFVFKNVKPAEFAMGFRTKIAKDVAIIDFIYAGETEVLSDGTEIKEHYILSSIALTKDTAADLIQNLKKFVEENGN